MDGVVVDAVALVDFEPLLYQHLRDERKRTRVRDTKLAADSFAKSVSVVVFVCLFTYCPNNHRRKSKMNFSQNSSSTTSRSNNSTSKDKISNKNDIRDNDTDRKNEGKDNDNDEEEESPEESSLFFEPGAPPYPGINAPYRDCLLWFEARAKAYVKFKENNCEPEKLEIVMSNETKGKLTNK